MKKSALLAVGLMVLIAYFLAAAGVRPAFGGKPEFVTLCHVAGLAGSTQEVTLTIPYNAAFGQAGHFNEDGTPNAGHEQDYLGACRSDTTTTETTTSTETTTTTTTETEPTTTTTPPGQPPCPNGEPPIHGKDGNPANDACDPCAPPVNIEKCPPPNDSTQITTTTPPPTTTEPPVTTTPEPPVTTTVSENPPTIVAPKPAKPKHKAKPKVRVSSTAVPPVCPVAKPHAGTCAVQGMG